MPITARNIRVVSGQGHVILNDVDVTAPDASVTLIIGRNGAGKSTLLDALSGLVQLQAGQVHYDAIPLWSGKRINRTALRQFGNVFQHPEQQLFAQTVEGEFAFSLKYLRLPPAEVTARAHEALRQADLSEAWLSASPHHLSGGIKRRVALASTIAADPRWLLLDEPTAGLDAEGVSALLKWLQQRREEGKGIVIATHDLDNMLPLADQVIVLQNGRVAVQIAREDIVHSSSLLHEAGLGVPPALHMAELLTAHGEKLSHGYPHPELVAEAIATRSKWDEVAAAHEDVEAGSGPNQDSSRPVSTDAASEAPSDAARGGLAAVDPRAKWLFSLLMSIGILLQTNWLGLLISSVIMAIVVASVRGAWRTMLKLSLPFAIFIMISMLVSGLEFTGGVGFALASSMRTLFELTKILIALGIGVGFAASTSQLMMKQALEQSLSGLRKLHFPVTALALAASLILRFIPVLMKEYRRFARIVRARGKQPTRSGGVRLRELPAMFIPLLISLFQLASDLTTAMEARGLTSFHQKRTTSFVLEMKRRDWFVVIIAVAGFAMLLSLTLL